jgi:hypothetical protein
MHVLQMTENSYVTRHIGKSLSFKLRVLCVLMYILPVTCSWLFALAEHDCICANIDLEVRM